MDRLPHRTNICISTREPMVAQGIGSLFHEYAVQIIKPEEEWPVYLEKRPPHLFIIYDRSTYCLEKHQIGDSADIPQIFISNGWSEKKESVFQAGLSGYLGPGCSFQNLQIAVEVVLDGGFYFNAGAKSKPPIGILTDRQIDVLRLIAGSYTDQEIGSALGIEISTVRHHISALYRRFDIDRRNDLTILASLGGITDIEDIYDRS